MTISCSHCAYGVVLVTLASLLNRSCDHWKEFLGDDNYQIPGFPHTGMVGSLPEEGSFRGNARIAEVGGFPGVFSCFGRA